jgi:hypothetical protein
LSNVFVIDTNKQQLNPGLKAQGSLPLASVAARDRIVGTVPCAFGGLGANDNPVATQKRCGWEQALDALPKAQGTAPTRMTAFSRVGWW